MMSVFRALWTLSLIIASRFCEGESLGIWIFCARSAYQFQYCFAYSRAHSQPHPGVVVVSAGICSGVYHSSNNTKWGTRHACHLKCSYKYVVILQWSTSTEQVFKEAVADEATIYCNAYPGDCNLLELVTLAWHIFIVWKHYSILP